MVKQGSRQIGTNRSFEAGTMAHNPCPTVDIYAHQDRVREALHHVEAKKMTLVLGMLGRDGMVMAADSRMVQPVHGERVARTTDMKLVQTGRSVVVGIVGDAVPGYRVVERVKDKVGRKRAGPERIAELLRKYGITQADDRRAANPSRHDERYVGLLVGGYESPEEPRLYYLRSALDFDIETFDSWAVEGTCRHAWLLCEMLHSQERSVEELIALAEFAISAQAKDRPGNVSLPARIITIRPDGDCTTIESSSQESANAAMECHRRRMSEGFWTAEEA